MAFKAKRKQYEQHRYSLFKSRVTIPAKKQKRLPLDGKGSYDRPRGCLVLDEPRSSGSGRATNMTEPFNSGPSLNNLLSTITDDLKESSTTISETPNLEETKKTQVSFKELYSTISVLIPV